MRSSVVEIEIGGKEEEKNDWSDKTNMFVFEIYIKALLEMLAISEKIFMFNEEIFYSFTISSNFVAFVYLS